MKRKRDWKMRKRSCKAGKLWKSCEAEGIEFSLVTIEPFK